MKREIQYLNTDLDLISPTSLDTLVSALSSRGLDTLHDAQHDDGLWYATFESGGLPKKPELNIVALLANIETLDPASQKLWSACTVREFNIGYECGEKPRCFSQEITAATLARAAALGISLRITLYPMGPGEP